MCQKVPRLPSGLFSANGFPSRSKSLLYLHIYSTVNQITLKTKGAEDLTKGVA